MLQDNFLNTSVFARQSETETLGGFFFNSHVLKNEFLTCLNKQIFNFGPKVREEIEVT